MRRAKCVLAEAALVAAAGFLLALGANALSTRGLHLATNYFPDSRSVVATAHSATNQSVQAAIQTSTNGLDAAALRLQQRGLQVMTVNSVSELVRDPSYDQGLAVVIDARDDAHYQAGHIPRAWQFDHYHADQYLPAVLPVCMNAQKVVVYCTGGSCEDSEFAATMLREAGVPAEHLFVFTGGITEWVASGQLVETGARGSGTLVKAKP